MLLPPLHKKNMFRNFPSASIEFKLSDSSMLLLLKPPLPSLFNQKADFINTRKLSNWIAERQSLAKESTTF